MTLRSTLAKQHVVTKYPRHSYQAFGNKPLQPLAMVSIASLLNPFPSASEHCHQLPSPCPSKYTPEPSPIPPPKTHKMSKDAAIFAKGKIQGEIRYRPCEYQDEEIAEQHRLFKVYPMGKIAEYCRHIPYNSEKKSFLERTGRESFEGNSGFLGSGRSLRLIH